MSASSTPTSRRYPTITSQIQGAKDPMLRKIRQLQSARGRQEQASYLVEGEKTVLRALAFGAPLQSLLVTPGFGDSPLSQECIAQLRQKPTPTYGISEGLMARLCKSKPTPSCLAVLAQETHAPEALAADASLLLMADRLANLDNLGMLLRSTEAAGVEGVLLSGQTADPFHPRVARASCGGLFRTRLAREASGWEVVETLQAQGFQVVAASANQGVAYSSIDYRGPTAILVGNEQLGLPADLLDAADAIACIPMAGSINSLNIAVAASVLLFEAQRQRSL